MHEQNEQPNGDIIDSATGDVISPLQGYFTVEILRDGRNGVECISKTVHKNTVLNAGKKQMWRMLTGLSTKLFKFGRAGSNSAAAISANTNVKTAITGTLKTVDSITMSGRTLNLIWSYASGAATKSGSFKEVAILNQRTSPGGSALARALLSPVAPKTTADKLKLTYTIRTT